MSDSAPTRLLLVGVLASVVLLLLLIPFSGDNPEAAAAGDIVPGLSGQDEDIIAFTPTSLGGSTAGAWAMYFDGSDVGLADSKREDVNAVAVDAAGNISLSVIHSFSVTGLTGLDEDVFVCDSPTTGTNTSCSSFTLLFDGDVYGLAFGGNDVFAIDLP